MDFQTLQQFSSLLRRRWLLANLVLAMALLFTQTPVYEASTKLLFKRASSVSSLGLSAGSSA